MEKTKKDQRDHRENIIGFPSGTNMHAGFRDDLRRDIRIASLQTLGYLYRS